MLQAAAAAQSCFRRGKSIVDDASTPANRTRDGARLIGQASDIVIQANEVFRMRTWLEQTLAGHSGRTPEQVNEDIERDKFLSAAEAKDYGLIDEVLVSRKASAQ